MAIPWLIGAVVVGAASYIAMSDDDDSSSSSSSSSSAAERSRELERKREQKEKMAKEKQWQNQLRQRAKILADKYEIADCQMVQSAIEIKGPDSSNTELIDYAAKRVREMDCSGAFIELQQNSATYAASQKRLIEKRELLSELENAMQQLGDMDEQFR